MRALLLAIAIASPSPAPTKPTITLTVWPQGQRIWGGQPLYAGAAVRVDDPQSELACPEIRVDWGDGSSSSGGSSGPVCDAYGVDRPIGYGFIPKIHAYRGPGQFMVVACVVGVRGQCLKGLTATRLVSIRARDEGRQRWARR